VATRNLKHFRHSPTPAVPVKELLATFFWNSQRVILACACCGVRQNRVSSTRPRISRT
jgi:hypothetical protein